jgi:4-alpha-glucanotransferase
LEAPGQAGWLADWTLFAALSGSPLTGGERCWRRWPEALRRRDPAAVERARAALSAEVAFHGFVQFLFFEQVAALRRGAAALGIETIGDLPFYPALESADVWARPEIFDLDEGSRPRHVAGVPPDAYTDQGQLWGHPVLRWAEEPEACRRWWIERTRSALSQTDRVRLDHFRGYAAFWSVPADAETAAAGEWVEGPGAALFEAARAALGGLPFVAEDLGYITDDVRRLLADTGLPGMRVLQFAFGPEGAADHLPANVPEHGVYCTSTHDNDTARGWFATLGEAEARRVLETVDGRPETVHRDLLRAALESRAELVLAPVQDLLGLGSEARLNTPGVSHGQWAWRLGAVPGEAVADDLRRLVESSGRLTPRASSPPA